MSATVHSIGHIDAALFYEARGWSVVPVHKSVTLDDGAVSCTCKEGTACASPGKHPALDDWKQYQEFRAPPLLIKRWFEGPYAGYGVGIITGTISGIFVVDVDEGPGKAGADTIQDLQMVHDDLPPTVTAKTGGGGRHLIFAHPGDGKLIKTGRNTLGPGVDTRGDGGFIVCAPSLHVSGRIYLWDENAHPKTVEPAQAPDWLIEMATSDDAELGGSRNAPTGSGEIVRDAWGKVIDGRERWMAGVICGVIASHVKLHKALPSADQVFEDAWPTYERTTRARGASLDADGRGRPLMRNRIKNFLRRAQTGRWKIRDDAEQAQADPSQEQSEQPRKPNKPSILTIAELVALPPPKWLVRGLVPEKGLVVPYGPPKVGKSFLAMSQSLHIAAGKDWFGYEVTQGGVVYIAGEGVGGMGLRIAAMMTHYNIGPDIPFWIIPRSIAFQDQAAVREIPALIRSAADDEPIGLIVIDTLARAMPGVEENSAKELGAVIAQIDWLREALECAVMPVHHTGKDIERGLRGSMALTGALDASFLITQPERGLVRMVNDNQKEAEEAPTLEFEMRSMIVPGTVGRTSLVPVLAEYLMPQVDHRPMWRSVALALGESGKMTLRAVGEALGFSNHKRQDLANSLPFYPDYETVDMGADKAVMLQKVRQGSAPNSPILVVRSEVK